MDYIKKDYNFNLYVYEVAKFQINYHVNALIKSANRNSRLWSVRQLKNYALKKLDRIIPVHEKQIRKLHFSKLKVAIKVRHTCI